MLAVALGIVALAGYKQMLRPGVVLTLGVLAAGGLVLSSQRRISWGGCAAVTFIVLGLGVYHLQPAYNRQFALRGHLRGDADLADIDRLPVVCYPQRWDSVSFYLPQADVRVYTLEQRQQLLADLRSRPRTLMLVKSGKVLEELLRDLPESIEFVAHGRPGVVTAGWVYPRPEPPGAIYARRQAYGHSCIVFLSEPRTQRSGVSGRFNRLLRCAAWRGSDLTTNRVRLLGRLRFPQRRFEFDGPLQIGLRSFRVPFARVGQTAACDRL